MPNWLRTHTDLIIEEVSLFGPEIAFLPLLDEGGPTSSHGQLLHVALHADLPCPAQRGLAVLLVPLDVGIQILYYGNLFRVRQGCRRQGIMYCSQSYSTLIGLHTEK